MVKIQSYLTVLLFLVLGCQKETTPVILEPGAAILVAPLDEETCLDGSSINDSQSNVTFQWNVSSNAVSYQVIVENLLTQSSQTYTSQNNETTVALSKAEPYSWKVKSIGEEGSTAVDSEIWKFYLAGDAVINYAPFPSTLIAPRSGANITPDINNLVTLQWAAVDVDDDLSSIEVYLDKTDGSTLNQTLDYITKETQLEVQVDNQTVYYWKVIAIDSNGNKSSSGVYSFRTN
tara:strand:+ start:858 stop:1556 length:699 start_codon:yes stop_codon:yes gene_type:complete